MHATLQSPGPQEAKRSVFPITIAASAIAVLVVAAVLWFLLGPGAGHNAPGGSATGNLKMSPTEQQYVENIQIGNITLSRAENFLHQEVTTVSGELYNGGNESVSGLRLTTQFSDDMNQVVLRETRDVSGTPERPFAAGERRTFEISFEHVPSSWNMQQPSVRVNYLHLPNHK